MLGFGPNQSTMDKIVPLRIQLKIIQALRKHFNTSPHIAHHTMSNEDKLETTKSLSLVCPYIMLQRYHYNLSCIASVLHYLLVFMRVLVSSAIGCNAVDIPSISL